jgi:hypothetical protein
MYHDIKRWVDSFILCNKRKPVQDKRQGFLQPQVVKSVSHTVSIDILGPLVISSKGRKYILVDHMPPLRLLSDRGNQFTSSLLRQLCKKMGIKSVYTTG